jgi:ABC-type sugar transport system permease subunit
LLWEDIEQVQWTPQYAIVRCGKTAITFNWHIYDGDDATRAKQIVESALSPAFDLAEYQRPQLFRPGFWHACIWFAKMVAISIPLAAISLSGTLVTALYAPDASWAEALGLISLFTPWLLVIPVAMQTRWRYPRWRKRRHDARRPSEADRALPQ